MLIDLTLEQDRALLRLQRLLCRRSEVDAYEVTVDGAEQEWLVRALDHAIVSCYRLAYEFGMEQQAADVLRRYRGGDAAAALCGELPLAA